MEYKVGSDITDYLSTLLQKSPEANFQLADPSLVQYYLDLDNKFFRKCYETCTYYFYNDEKLF